MMNIERLIIDKFYTATPDLRFKCNSQFYWIYINNYIEFRSLEI